MSGLCAALTALEEGARVAVVEKSAALGGSMNLSNGLIWTFENKEQLHLEIRQGDEALQDFVVEELPAGLKWLVSNGVALAEEQTFQWYGWGRRANPAQMGPALEDRIRALGATIMTDTSLDTLIVSEGSVVGAVVDSDSGRSEIRAKSVVIATGGFQGNPELVGRYITSNAHDLYLRSNPFSTGDGFLAAMSAGAATSELMHSFYGHALVAPPARFNQFEFQSISQKYGVLSVAVNLRGERFTDEAQGTGEEDLNFAIAHQPEATAIYIVDSKIADMEWKDNAPGRVAISRAKTAGGPVAEADTLEALAQKLKAWGVPPKRLLETIEEYNRTVGSDEGADLHPPRVKHQIPLAVGPFTAVKVKAGITYTCGGLKTDLDMAVMRRSRSISSFRHLRAGASDMRMDMIPGLFACGCDVGGISNWGYMGGLSQALVTGRAAGRSAASAALASVKEAKGANA